MSGSERHSFNHADLLIARLVVNAPNDETLWERLTEHIAGSGYRSESLSYPGTPPFWAARWLARYEERDTSTGTWHVEEKIVADPRSDDLFHHVRMPWGGALTTRHSLRRPHPILDHVYHDFTTGWLYNLGFLVTLDGDPDLGWRWELSRCEFADGTGWWHLFVPLWWNVGIHVSWLRR